MREEIPQPMTPLTVFTLDGKSYVIPEKVREHIYKLFDCCEGIRVDLCALLEIDYLEASDKDIFDAIRKLKKEKKGGEANAISKEE